MTTATNTNATVDTKEAKDPLDADFTIYQTKPPSDLHELHAELITQLSGVEISAKQVQVVLAMHGKIQASEANRKRKGYRPRTAQSIRKGGITTVEHFNDILAEQEKAAEPTPKPRSSRARKTTGTTTRSRKATKEGTNEVKLAS